MNIAVVHSFHCCCWSTNALWWLHTWLVYCEWIYTTIGSLISSAMYYTRKHYITKYILFNIQLVVLYERVVSRICSIWMILLTNPCVTIICVYTYMYIFFYFMYADWLQIMCWSDEKPQAICLNTASHRICSLFDMYYTCTVRVVRLTCE